MMQLEHCPFCGTNHTLIPDGSGRYQQIVCGACGARGPEVYRTLPYAVAAESWNVRQAPGEVNETHRPAGVRASDDTARLDYLQRTGSTLEILPGTTQGARFRFRVGGLHAAVSDDLRAAIDTASGVPPIDGSQQ
jgi:hypothetical protein